MGSRFDNSIYLDVLLAELQKIITLKNYRNNNTSWLRIIITLSISR
jgi:hypothetical protein